ncbi:MAG: hypothetical protein D6790_11415, partial [Caldilineae bacterium]
MGTASPAYKLDVNGHIGIRGGGQIILDPLMTGSLTAARIAYSATSPITGHTPANGVSGKAVWLTAGYSSDEGGIGVTDDGVIITGAGDTDLLRVFNEDANRYDLVIKDSGDAGFSGKLGIGTMTPANKLEVRDTTGTGVTFGLSGTTGKNLIINEAGDAEIGYGSYPGAWTPALQIQNNTNGRLIWLSPLDSSSGANARFRAAGTGLDFYVGGTVSNGGTLSVSLSSNGNVGMGTTSPTQKLHVSGNIRVTGAYYDSSNSAGTNGYLLQSTGNGTKWVNASSLADSDWIISGNNMYSGVSGNVGIGTTVPAFKLDVRQDGSGPQIVVRGTGGISTDHAIGFIYSTASDWVGKVGHLGSLTGSWSLDLWTDESAPITFWNASTEKMRIQPNGFVGIG